MTSRSDIEGTRSARADNAAVRSLPFASVLELVSDVAFVVNPERRVAFTNEACRRRFATSGDAIGLAPGELLGCDSAVGDSASCRTGDACISCGLDSVIRRAAQTGSAEGPTRVRLPHGQVMDLDVRAMSVTTADGRRHVLVVTQDRSAEHWQRQLDRAFFHDALDLAAGIVGLAELREAGAATEGDAEAIVGLATELVETIRDHRTLKAAEAGDLAIDVDTVDLASIVDTAIDVNRRLAEQRSVRVQGEVGRPDTLTTDRNLLTRVLSNLIRNAIEASSPGDGVIVRTRPVDDEHVEISVHNPVEIPPEVQSRIFRRPASTKGANRGTGTFSARLLTERYLEGSIHFVTGPQLGTTFSLHLPLRHARAFGDHREA